MSSTLGWDIGGVNTKLARVECGRVQQVVNRPFELQRAPDTLASLLREMVRDVGGAAAWDETGGDPPLHALTMTAELSQMFRTKREGVCFIVDAVERAFDGAGVHVFTTDGTFVTPAEARLRPLVVAAANWSATAAIIAEMHRDAVLIDVGTTTTDIIPIVGRRVAALGRTDPERLASGELVYSGVVRTPVEAVVSDVPLGPGRTGVSAEGFALTGDVHVWRGALPAADYTWPTPDGRPPTRDFARERLARVVCADTEMLDDAAIDAIASAVAVAQTTRIAGAIRQVLARHPSLRIAVVTGLGVFVAEAAAAAAGLRVAPLASDLGDAAARCAPAAAVALLLEQIRCRSSMSS